MKKKFYNLLIILALSFSFALSVHAEEVSPESPSETPTEIIETPELPTTTATLRIETTNGVVFDSTITITACKPYEAATEYTLNAKCLIDQAAGLSSTWNFFGTEAFLNSVNEYTNDFGANLFWGYFINLEYGSTALNAYTLHEGDEILLVYGVNPLKIETVNNTPTLYTTTTIRVYEFDLDESWNPVWLPSNSSTILVDGTEYAVSANGTVEINFTTHGSHTLQATKAGFAQSNVASVETKLPTTSAKLYTIANGTALFDQTITVTACKPYEAATEYTLNAKCLIDQAAGLSSTWNFFGTEAFLNSVNEYTNDFGANLFWGYFINLEYGSTALNAYTLHEGDEILIQYKTIPLKLEVSNKTPKVGDSVTVSVYEFGLDENWNPVWVPSASSTLTIYGVSQILENNAHTFIIAGTSTILRVEKNGYVPREAIITASEVPVITPPAPGNSGGSGGGNSTSNPTQSLINFLDAKQNNDGSFGSSTFLNDWAAVAYGGWSGSQTGKSKLSAYLLTDPNPLDGPNPTTNYARRAMGLMSLGINPYTGTKTNYIQSILNGFDGSQFGDSGLINDDIFALVPLLKAGYTDQDALVVSTTKNIIAGQTANGSFGSIDLTAAAIQALTPVSTLSGVNDALTKAKEYLRTSQQSDGSFGNVYGTSWTMQAISALGENQTSWTINGNTPLTYTFQNQGTDGGLLPADIQTNRIWATTYAVPAVIGKSWNTILSSFSKPSTPSQTASGSSGSSQPSTVASTPVTTSTTQTTTSTITQIPVTTTTTTTSTAQTSIELHITEIVSIPEITEIKIPALKPIVLGERITDPYITQDISVTLTSTVENVDQDKNDAKPTEPISEPDKSNTKKYIFLTSLILFLGLLVYMGLSAKKAKK